MRVACLRSWRPAVAPVLLFLALSPARVTAHAFGQRYDLPLPLNLYLWAAGFAVALSFLVMVLFLRVGASGTRRWIVDLGDTLPARLLTARPTRQFFAAVGLCLFALVLITGLRGEQDPSKNFAPIFVWVIWWVGFAYLAAFLGNVWDLVNPWASLFRATTRVLQPLARPLWEYPLWLGCWPAVVQFLVFAWLEFISGIAQQPATLAWLVIAYSLGTLVGMRCFGLQAWLRHGEVFAVLFGLMARFGLFRGEGRELYLRLPGAGLVSTHPVSPSLLAFTVLMLATVSFDGFIETPFWVGWNTEAYQLLMSAGSPMTSSTPASVQQAILSIALLLFYLLFVGAYLGVSALVCRLSTAETSALLTARAYVLSLVPIAIAYHLAHYLSYLMIAGQLVIPIISDPFGLGWNLFGTAGYRVDISVIDAGDVWYLSMCAIVVGHIASVWIGHAIALQRERTPRSAVISQLPMVILMIAYTMISLWILSQPIVA